MNLESGAKVASFSNQTNGGIIRYKTSNCSMFICASHLHNLYGTDE